MSALTDEGMAKVLGWIRVAERRTAHGRVRLSGIDPRLIGKTPYNVPAFTTSLDAITAEIEAMGLWWKVGSRIVVGSDKTYWASVRSIGAEKAIEVTDSTAPLALCAALRDYLKKN